MAPSDPAKARLGFPAPRAWPENLRDAGTRHGHATCEISPGRCLAGFKHPRPIIALSRGAGDAASIVISDHCHRTPELISDDGVAHRCGEPLQSPNPSLTVCPPRQSQAMLFTHREDAEPCRCVEVRVRVVVRQHLATTQRTRPRA